MKYQVIQLRGARKELAGLARYAKDDYRAVIERLRSLSQEPRPRDGKQLVGSPLWRLRVRDLRIVYAIDDTEKVVRIVRITRRSEDTYKGL